MEPQAASAALFWVSRIFVIWTAVAAQLNLSPPTQHYYDWWDPCHSRSWSFASTYQLVPKCPIVLLPTWWGVGTSTQKNELSFLGRAWCTVHVDSILKVHHRSMTWCHEVLDACLLDLELEVKFAVMLKTWHSRTTGQTTFHFNGFSCQWLCPLTKWMCPLPLQGALTSVTMLACILSMDVTLYLLV